MRFRLIPTLLLTLTILALPTAIYAWGRTSSSFLIEKVIVAGAERVPERRLLRLLRRDYLGRNLFTVTSDDVRQTLAGVSYVAGVSVDRDFPATLRVLVEEHVPAACVLAGHRWYAVSTEGVVITALGDAAAAGDGRTADADGMTAGGDPSSREGVLAADLGAAHEGDVDATPSPSAPPPPNGVGGAGADQGEDAAAEELAELEAGPPGTELRRPRLAAREPVRPGRTLDDADARLAVSVVVALPPALRTRPAIVVAEDGWVTLRFTDGLEVVWGDGERLRAKRIALRKVLNEYEREGVSCTYIDVSTPDRALARPVLQ